MAEFVTVYEVGPRDGLQNEKEIIPVEDKIALVDRLSEAGFRKIEVTSFVSPKWVPQLADAAEVLAGISRRSGVVYSALTPNLKGLEAALAAKVDEVAIFASASETFSRRNINCSIAESFERFAPVMEAAKTAGVPVRGYVSCVVACPYEGPVAPEAVRLVAERLIMLGCHEISLGDTIGAGVPETISAMLDEVLRSVPVVKLAGHFHDTGNRALANVEIALDYGLRTFDSAVGGLGGCPYAPGAKGNVATGPLVELLEGRGFETGIDAEKLKRAEAFIKGRVGRLSGRNA
ncbi:hydroxymethylglutaryl-CoA lyase [Ciceribacter ferrooxidans]|uniref:Hydroxymethylglutaryl-CoA lyase n=1 Tax=Ciceribacter ferrooxidans TaxID=2509717 RepID=A0A4Q2TEA9_9HYPH|nr:hydroxymethylglutaryl-CoA lyase [Ciceribacter ferrooxidans]RYC15705.1 hydroxymethylglutaryl-CoA lyase [Ciceribacter ferrooxidans]